MSGREMGCEGGGGLDQWHGLVVIDTGWISPCCPRGFKPGLVNHGAWSLVS